MLSAPNRDEENVAVEAGYLPPGPAATLAGFWPRMAALLIDLLRLAVPAFLLGFALFTWLVTLGQAGRLIGSIVALAYFGLLNSRLGDGQTIGKRLLNIRAVGRDGKTLSPARSVLRQWYWNYRETHDAAAWRAKLQQATQQRRRSGCVWATGADRSACRRKETAP